MKPSDEQQAIIDAPLVPIAVIACAGSGKTATAIRRLVAMRRLLGDNRGRVALLSFSNTAVETFRKGYRALTQDLPIGAHRDRVDIDTLDAFITGHILRPHAHRTMGSSKAAFLVGGTEPFLNGFKCWKDKLPVAVTQVRVGIHDTKPFFYYDVHGNLELLDQYAAASTVASLGRTGAYTHDLGRYWCYRTLIEQPLVTRALARRYPQILVDESQDIGLLHQAILEVLSKAGVQISLIGDPHQGIFEFAGANGEFLRNYSKLEGVSAFSLTRNYRSIPTILELANKLSGRNDEPDREAPGGSNGAYFIVYTDEQIPQLIDAFSAEIANVGLNVENAAILCRSSSLKRELSGATGACGRGTVKIFAEAATLRDSQGRFNESYKAVVRALISLMEDPPKDLATRLNNVNLDPSLHDLKRRIWSFTRDTELGLPSSDLAAAADWHPKLLVRVRHLLIGIQKDFGFAPTDNLGRKLARTDLPIGPLSTGLDLAAQPRQKVRVETVHQVKGEGIDAVLYVATRAHIKAMLEGVQTELGRIGYVAVTRARNLFWLGVPATAVKALRPGLLAAGFREVGEGNA